MTPSYVFNVKDIHDVPRKLIEELKRFVEVAEAATDKKSSRTAKSYAGGQLTAYKHIVRLLENTTFIVEEKKPEPISFMEAYKLQHPEVFNE